MSEYIIREVNCETGEEIDRQPTAQELKQFQKDQKDHEDRLAAEALKQAKKAELLERLGITEDEAKLLLA